MHVPKAGLWIRIDSIRIWIRHFSSIQIRIHIYKIIESGSNADLDPELIKNKFLFLVCNSVISKFKVENNTYLYSTILFL
jgi:hypothetical protein